MPQIARLKRNNPRLRVFLYKNAMATSIDQTRSGHDLPRLTTGVGYADARNNHPGWFVHDSGGAAVPFADYPENRWMDVANRAYQSQWASDVVADVQRYGADGVMIDDVNTGYGTHLPIGTTLPKYPTGSAWATAQEAFLAAVTARLHDAGVESLANISQPSSPESARHWHRWLGYLDGVVYEYWTKYGIDSTVRPETGDAWQRQLRRADEVARANKLFVPVTYGGMSDVQAQRYARASFLLTWNGGPAAQTWVPDQPADPWLRIDRLDIGRPTAPRHHVAPFVYVRHFTGGVVAVNGGATLVTVHLHDHYVDDRGKPISAVELGPTSAVILRR